MLELLEQISIHNNICMEKEASSILFQQKLIDPNIRIKEEINICQLNLVIHFYMLYVK